MQELNSASDRIEHLRWISRQDWARSNSPVLRTTIVSDPDESVQLEAVETALELARGEGAGATSSVVRTALASTKGNTRARGLKAAREHPDPALVSELIGLVDNGDPYAAMALSALAHADSADAREKVFAVAQDADTEPKLRERAVALLAVTKEREARPLLIELANGENESLARIAQEVLNVINEG
jgi:HEAT repeat protein